MRKVTLFFLMAACAAPALAAADGQSGERGRSSERSSDVSEDRDSHRPSEESRLDRAAKSQQVERSERAESGRNERSERVRDAAPAQILTTNNDGQREVRVERRGEDGGRGFGMRRRGSEGRRQSGETVQQSVQQQDARQWNGWQPRERRVRSIPDTNVSQHVGMTSPERPASTIQRRYRDGDGRRWSQRWRNDGRFDWRRHRDRHRSAFRIGFYYDPFGWRYRRFGIGSYMWPTYFGSRYWINDPWQYRLPPAYGPYRWVRYHNDALLIDTWSGEVVDVIYGFFW